MNYANTDMPAPKGKVHFQHTRLYNNAGMEFPQCAANAKLLDTDKWHWNTTPHADKVTCKRCLQIMAKLGASSGY